MEHGFSPESNNAVLTDRGTRWWIGKPTLSVGGPSSDFEEDQPTFIPTVTQQSVPSFVYVVLRHHLSDLQTTLSADEATQPYK